MDIQKEINSKQSNILGYKSYLRETDYKAIKSAELGIEMADDVKDARQHARDEINRLEYEVELLVEQLEEQQDEQIEEDFHENISLR